MSTERTERHQERERKQEPCGCESIWCRGRWWPSGLTCREHLGRLGDSSDPDDRQWEDYVDEYGWG